MAPGRRRTATVAKKLIDGRDSVANREFDERRDVLDFELRHQAAAIRLDALRRKLQPLGRLCDRPAFDRMLQHLALARAEPIEWIGDAALAKILLERLRTHLLADVAAPAMHRPDRFEHDPPRAILEDVALRAR